MRIVDAGATVTRLIARLPDSPAITRRPTPGDLLLATVVLFITVGGMLTFAEAGVGSPRPRSLRLWIAGVAGRGAGLPALRPLGHLCRGGHDDGHLLGTRLTILFDLTTGTAIFAVAFSTVLGMLAGIVPAWSAARLDPVAALRYE